MDINPKFLEVISQEGRNLEDYKSCLKLLLPTFLLGETESAHTGRSEPWDSLQETHL